MSNPLHSEQQYLDIAAQERALLDAGSCLPLNARRDQAAEVLKKNGLPTHRVERYKYCDVPEAFACLQPRVRMRLIAATFPI